MSPGITRLEGRVAVVTGGVQGIGRAVALRLAAEGAAVVVGDLQDDDSTVKQIVADGGQGSHIVMDTRQRGEWKRLIDEAVGGFGRLDMLANIAGVTNTFGPDTVVDLDDNGWDHVIDTDLRGVWLGMQAAIPRMLDAGGGSIVNIGSMAALKGLENLAAYSAAKGGVVSLTQQAAMEYGPRGIRVNCICPGTIDTPILAGITESMRENFTAAHIIPRLGRAEDIAAAAAFLFSDDAAFCTGEILPVDGGWNTKGSAG
ncbi:beta-ketoacyl-ACP reductase [Actinomycetospora corticicola]|uniref:NAD(P)-dependent dehydrogenase (Short-subunit alcohol dehydrogenase family) n=1 Tax=Actinomycetospora corticicola TaxID=663602 RepID=A0A7Y9DSK1_9PSEU|nr:SDR family NAD(P)-dependent oxidoreductase [Actinomycetospora corticicola]NYD34635.1 NAD(P)-dependent dehydrogenase (short-subunit alcohol dehydrogenase family) [Actinomycetospora corticicola]